MANHLLDKTFKAGSVIAQFHAVIQTTDDTVIQNTTLGGLVQGVAQEVVDAADVATGKKLVACRGFGISKAVAGAAIPVNSKVAAMANGRFQVAAATQNVIGIARSAAAVTGDWFELEIYKGGLA